MTRIIQAVGIVAFVLAAANLTALEIGAHGTLGTLDFARDRDSTASSLPGDIYLWGIGVFGTQAISEDLAIDIEFDSDPILRNIGSTLLTYRGPFFSIRFGPFFGILNAPGTIVQSGLSTTVHLFVPGIVILGLRSDTSLASRLVAPGDYIQEQSELSLGVYVPNAIPTLYARTKRYTWKTTTGEAVDTLHAYGLRTDVFEKNVPYRVVLDFAYQDASRTFHDAQPSTHRHGSLVLGKKIVLDVFDPLRLLVDLESSIYTFGLDELLGETSRDRYLFRLRVGASYRIDL